MNWAIAIFYIVMKPLQWNLVSLFRRKNIYLFSHVTTVPDDSNVKALEKKFSRKTEVLENHTKEIQSNMEKEISEKFTKFETQMNNLQKDLEIKNIFIFIMFICSS